MSWEQIKFGDFITLQRGHDLTREQFILGEYPVVSSTTIMGYHNEYKAKAPGVVIGRSGTLGEVQYIKTNYWPHNTSLYVKDFKGNNPKFVYYFLKNFGTEASGGGSAVPTLNRNNLNVLDVSIPDISSQNKIADILSAYDDLIENNQKQIKLLEEAAQRLYKEWFVDLRFPGHENTPIIDGVPQGWRKSYFSEIFSFVRGKSYTSKELSENDGILMVNLKNIRSFGGYKRNAEKRFTGTYKEEQLLAGGDVVMGVTDMTQERRLVGHVALIPSFNEKVTFSMDLIKLIPYSVTKNYLYCTMQYGGYSEQIAPLANGVNVLHLKPEAMMKMEMLVPNELVMREFDIKFEAIRLKIEALEKQCDLAAQARDRLLPKLMSGELEE